MENFFLEKSNHSSLSLAHGVSVFCFKFTSKFQLPGNALDDIMVLNLVLPGSMYLLR